MSDAIDELYSAIEKAKGLFPRGGSSKLKAKFDRISRTSGHGKLNTARSGRKSMRNFHMDLARRGLGARINRSK